MILDTKYGVEKTFCELAKDHYRSDVALQSDYFPSINLNQGHIQVRAP